MELWEKYSKYTHLKMMSRNVKHKGFVVVEIKHWYGLLSYSRLLHVSHFNTHCKSQSCYMFIVNINNINLDWDGCVATL